MCVLTKYAKKHDFKRGTPGWEKRICSIMSKHLKYTVPQGGLGLLIGTPTPFAIADNGVRNNKNLLDNLFVTKDLVDITYRTDIAIGNIENKKKAKEKARMFRSIFSRTEIRKITVCPVTGDTYYDHISKLLKKGSSNKYLQRKPVVVVLLTSGTWNGRGVKQKYNTDFRTPSIELTSKHPNLYILAMVRETGTFGYSVRYLNKGKNRMIQKL